MVKTYGLTHVELAVRDVERSFAFYRQVVGVVEVYRGEGFLQAQTPGSRDVLLFERDPDRAEARGGVAHSGFRLLDPADIDAAAAAVTGAGERSSTKGSSAPASLTCSSPIRTVTRWRSGASCRPRLTRPPRTSRPPPEGRWPSPGRSARSRTTSRRGAGWGWCSR